MLVQFATSNYRSIHKKKELSLVPQSISDSPKENIAQLKAYTLLKSAAIYGANSSGKTNFIRAINQMRSYIVDSVKLNDNDVLDFEPFKLSLSSIKEPSYFEIVFILNENQYRYGFELDRFMIKSEWLFKAKVGRKRDKVLFIRNEKGIGVDVKNFPEGEGKEKNTNDNRLFVSLCAQLGGEESKSIIEWFKGSLNIISGLDSDGYLAFSKLMLHKKLEGCDKAIAFFNNIGLGFQGLETSEEEFNPDILPGSIPEAIKNDIISQFKGKMQLNLESIHNVYNSKGDIVSKISFNAEDSESAGTQKLIQLSGPIFDTLIRGAVLVVDELDAKMHPLISEHIIKLFNNPKTNPNNAQLIFSTHDTNLLTSRLLRRDQIWFAEKDQREQTDLYNMMDIILPDGSKPRNDANYEKNYIAGRYGAIPYILNE